MNSCRRAPKALALAAALALALPLAADGVIELGAWQLSCSHAKPDAIRAAVADADALLRRRCGVGLRLAHLSPLPSLDAWCDLPPKRRGRLAVEDEFTRGPRGSEPRALSLFIVRGTQDGRMSWAEVPKRARPCLQGADEPALAGLGCVYMTDLAFDAIDAHDADRRNAGRPWRAALLAHEVVHAATGERHPTGRPAGNLMADALGDIGTALDAEQCACLRRSPFVK